MVFLRACLPTVNPFKSRLRMCSSNGRESPAWGTAWRRLQPGVAGLQYEPPSLDPEGGSSWNLEAFLQLKNHNETFHPRSFQAILGRKKKAAATTVSFFKADSPVFFLTSKAILKPSSRNSTTWTKSSSLNCREVRAGAPKTKKIQHSRRWIPKKKKTFKNKH